MPKPSLTTDEKLEIILKYQKRTHHWAVFRGIIALFFFLVFIVFPVIGGLYLFDYFKNNVDLTTWQNQWQEMKKQFQEFRDFGAEMPRLKELAPKK